ncbi:hypothetical protein BGW36DRAFT_423766 [Talaromyces proteolyticus]|uniref:FAD-containing monooxygenase EthA n=1 Tax=Talaromyces proteolyticus TaxID=1131652 RepID=A0AAD4KZ78_9EURO|nr:uncharacterized protein BGW36DRAFT_423766 [Talaromyces proteolyticus]KAH8704245.1 hypothetical protein BGW36DRAFT_423766 [Talaromyces proteolyticus]
MGSLPLEKVEQSFDVLIIGAGISGINSAYRLQSSFPQYRYAILEARDRIGGTWDLFRYPGIRSDSDLYTFGFPWYPWNRSNPIAEGKDILQYLNDAATEHKIKPNIYFNHHVLKAEWDQQRWMVNVESNGIKSQFSARFIIFGTGYYDYHEPLDAEIPGLQNFQGDVIHPQFWPEKFDYTDKNIVIIGSGATAVTLLPKLSEKAAKVTMLQRSPSYVVSIPNPASHSWLGRLLPTSWVYRFNRIRYLLIARFMFIICRRYPVASRGFLTKLMASQLPVGISVDPHFKPSYSPWEQRLCLCPDGDFFKSLRSGKGQIETGIIKTVDADGIQLTSGKKLSTDTIVTATGLKMQLAGRIDIVVNGERIDFSQKYIWNGFMLQDVPNAGFVIGYTNASWTLGAEASIAMICRILKQMESKHASVAVPTLKDPSKLETRSLMNLKSTYIARAREHMPKASSQRPWVPKEDYLSDMYFAKYGNITEGLKLTT